MKRFTFRYETVLKERDRLKGLAEEALQRAIAAWRQEEQALEALKAEEAECFERWQVSQREGAIDLQSAMLFPLYLEGLTLRQAEQEARIEQARRFVEEQRAALARAAQDHDIMLKLKERDEKAWRAAIDRAEALFIDELATSRHGRRPLS